MKESITLINLYKNKQMNVKEMGQCIQLLHSLMADGETEKIDQLLVLVDENSSAEMFVTMLRSTFRIKQYLLEWDNLLERAKIALKKQNINPYSELRGLL